MGLALIYHDPVPGAKLCPTGGDVVEVVLLRQPPRAPRQALVVAVDRDGPQQRPESRLAVHRAPGQVLCC